MTREEFLARCALIYDTGHARQEVLHVLDRAADAMMRYVHYAAVERLLREVQRGDASKLAKGLISPREMHWHWEAARQQKDIFDSIVSMEVERVLKKSAGAGGDGSHLMTLANDGPGYRAVEFTAILVHHCQTCATDPHAWWTRAGFCPHRKSGCDPGGAPNGPV